MADKVGRPITEVALALAAFAVVLAGIKFGAPVIGPILMSVFFAIILTPIVRAFTRRGLSYRTALVLVVSLSIGLGVLLIALIALSLSDLVDLIVDDDDGLDQTAEQLRLFFQAFGLDIMIVQVGSVFYNGFFVLFGTLFLLIELPILYSGMTARLGKDHLVIKTLEELYRDIVDYFIVRIKVNFYTSLGVTAVLLVMGIDYALLWGVLAFALSFVPYIGYLIAAIPPTLIAWVQYGVIGAIAVLVLYGLINLIAENLIFPRLAGKTFAIPVYVVFVSIFFWGWLLGLAGVLLAVPLTMAVIILLGQFAETEWMVPIFRGERTKAKGTSLFRRKAPPEGPSS